MDVHCANKNLLLLGFVITDDMLRVTKNGYFCYGFREIFGGKSSLSVTTEVMDFRKSRQLGKIRFFGAGGHGWP